MLEIKLGMAMLLNEFEVPIPKWKGALLLRLDEPPLPPSSSSVVTEPSSSPESSSLESSSSELLSPES